MLLFETEFESDELEHVALLVNDDIPGLEMIYLRVPALAFDVAFEYIEKVIKPQTSLEYIFSRLRGLEDKEFEDIEGQVA